MSAFVSSSATNQLIPPWVSEGCQTWCFAVEVGEANVRGYLDKYFNGQYPDRAPYTYAPLPGPQFGLITYAYHPRVFSCAPGQPASRLSFSEVIWTFPVRRRIEAGDRVDEDIVWVQPFSFCDNASVLFASREIWGADMVYAKLERHTPPSHDGPLQVDAAIEGIRKFSPNSKSELLGCLHISHARGECQLDDILEQQPQMAHFSKLVEAFRGGPDAAPTLNNLKQFRDTCDLRVATYRAIVESRSWHEKVVGPVFYTGASTTIDVLWSATITEMATSLLGIKEPRRQGPPPSHKVVPPPDGKDGGDWDLPRTRLTVQLAFSFQSDVHFATIDTLFTYGAGDRAARR